VYRLKQTFPELVFVLNGGVASVTEIDVHLARVDGVMLGRAAYHDSYLLAVADAHLSGGVAPARGEVVRAMAAYAEREMRAGTPLRAITRHLLGLYQGQPRARSWRRLLSDPSRLDENRPQVLLDALEFVEGDGGGWSEAA
jgi:tRNA-dihydrouridine synthase A